MAEITTELIKQLREETGAGMVDVKNALTESDGNREKAIELLRKKGLAAREKKASRATSQGLVESYIHAGGRVGVLVEVNCETDFVARTDDFKTLVKDIAMHIAASNPLYVKNEDVPTEVVEKEKEIAREQAKNEGKPEQVIEKIVEGRVQKFYDEAVLLNQPFVKNPDQKISDLIAQAIGKIGENIQIKRFTRFNLGE